MPHSPFGVLRPSTLLRCLRPSFAGRRAAPSAPAGYPHARGTAPLYGGAPPASCLPCGSSSSTSSRTLALSGRRRWCRSSHLRSLGASSSNATASWCGSSRQRSSSASTPAETALRWSGSNLPGRRGASGSAAGHGESAKRAPGPTSWIVASTAGLSVMKLQYLGWEVLSGRGRLWTSTRDEGLARASCAARP